MNTLAWLGTQLQILGAAALAARMIEPYWAYCLMLPGSLIWIYIAARRMDAPLAYMQIVFAILNVIGLARWAA